MVDRRRVGLEPRCRWVDGGRSEAGVWPWHARLGNALGARSAATPPRTHRPRHRTDARMPSCRPPGLGVLDRRFGYPVELLSRGRRSRLGRSPSTTSTTCRGPPARSPRCRARTRESRRPATSPGCCVTSRVGVIVLAKAPVAGLAKTRVAKDVGTARQPSSPLPACWTPSMSSRAWVGRGRRLIAWRAISRAAARGPELVSSARVVVGHQAARRRTWALASCTHTRMRRGSGAATRSRSRSAWTLHRSCAEDLRGPRGSGLATGSSMPALGLAADGGWWGLAPVHPRAVVALVDVPMSRPDTGSRTLSALIERRLLGGTRPSAA